MKANGSPVPQFETDADRTYFLAILPLHPLAGVAKKNGAHGGAHDGAIPRFTTAQVSLLRSVKTQPLSRLEIAERLGRGRRSGHILRTLSRLLDEGLIQLTLPDKPRSKLQRYRITDKGLLALRGVVVIRENSEGDLPRRR